MEATAEIDEAQKWTLSSGCRVRMVVVEGRGELCKQTKV